MGKNLCVVCEHGWIIKGVVADEAEWITKGVIVGETLKLKEASVVRHWKNGKGIGGIAKEENKFDYILDPIGDVEIMKGKILFTIPCEW